MVSLIESKKDEYMHGNMALCLYVIISVCGGKGLSMYVTNGDDDAVRSMQRARRS